MQQARLPFFRVERRDSIGSPIVVLYVETWVRLAIGCVSYARPMQAAEYQNRRAKFLRACAADPEVLLAALAIRDMNDQGRAGNLLGEDQIHAMVDGIS